MERGRLIEAVELMAAHRALGEDELAALLVAQGFDTGCAHRLVAFVPAAFAEPLLDELGCELHDEASVPGADGEHFEVRLDDQPEYVAARRLARDHVRSQVLAKAVFDAIALGSAEMAALDNAVAAGEDVAGSVVAVSLASPALADHVVRRRRGIFQSLQWWIEGE